MQVILVHHSAPTNAVTLTRPSQTPALDTYDTINPVLYTAENYDLSVTQCCHLRAAGTSAHIEPAHARQLAMPIPDL